MITVKGDQKQRYSCVTESEMVRGKNGIALFNEWSKPDNTDNCSRRDVARINRVKVD
jgi:hypothetical protein